MIFYNLGIRFLGFIFRIAGRLDSKARRWVEGRSEWQARLAAAITPGERVIWVHAASLGEFEQGRAIIEQIRVSQPEYKILLTFFSPSGYEQRKNYRQVDYVFYLPLDTPRNARQFVRIVNPEIAIFIKYEYWLNYLRELYRAGSKTYIISAIFRRDQPFFRWYGGIFRRGLGYFERIFVQDEMSRRLLSLIKVENATVAGDTRFDRVADIAAAAKDIDLVAKFCGNSPVFVAGSTWPPDEQILSGCIAPDLPPSAGTGLKWIIVPHEITPQHIGHLCSILPPGTLRYTECTEQTDMASARVLVVDTIGLLSSIYRYGQLGYIGGGFGTGIHNTLEAAAFGLPVAFGPNYEKFREACDLIDIGAARCVKTQEDLETWIDTMSDPVRRAEASEKAATYVSSHTGATEIILGSIFKKQ